MSAVQVGYGLITCQRHPDQPGGWSDLYQEALDLASAADAAGLASVWVSEHHFVDDGHLPSLMVLLGAMAARTTRIALGTGLLLAPLHDPFRVAEDAAVVDLLSRGRLVLGLGLGWRDEEFEAFGVAQRDRVARLTRLTEVLRTAWRGEPVPTKDGGAAPVVSPRPERSPGPALWIGALSEQAVRRAGRIADGFMATEVTPEELREQVVWASEERARAGIERPLEVALHLPTLVGTSFAESVELLRYPGWKYEDMSDARSFGGPLRRPPVATGDELSRLENTSLVGSVSDIADRVREYADAAGGRLHFIGRSYLPGMDPQQRLKALQELGQVADRFR